MYFKHLQSIFNPKKQKGIILIDRLEQVNNRCDNILDSHEFIDTYNPEKVFDTVLEDRWHKIRSGISA
ncbi:MAG: hypothetical protein K8R49_01530 [Candidatus Cloacimonetes bacterium]|nr:hypothetical protein [Candidatus Cloacimonadota bacterium]